MLLCIFWPLYSLPFCLVHAILWSITLHFETPLAFYSIFIEYKSLFFLIAFLTRKRHPVL